MSRGAVLTDKIFAYHRAFTPYLRKSKNLFGSSYLVLCRVLTKNIPRVWLGFPNIVTQFL